MARKAIVIVSGRHHSLVHYGASYEKIGQGTPAMFSGFVNAARKSKKKFGTLALSGV